VFRIEAMPHIESLYRMAVRNYRDPDLARDLVQETYKEAWKSFGNYRRGTNCKAWLFRILFRVAGREIRARNARTEVPLAGISDPKLTVAPKVEAGLTSRQILEILDKMPEDYRTIIVLADIEEMTYREIAESLGVPLGTVMSRLSRARALFRRRYRERERRECGGNRFAGPRSA
jgi:RNA polymerase sigma-70 factor, ECF subfamily